MSIATQAESRRERRIHERAGEIAKFNTCTGCAARLIVDEETARLESENNQLRIALADAIRRPMGVVPDSARGLITETEMFEAEKRREAKDGD